MKNRLRFDMKSSERTISWLPRHILAAIASLCLLLSGFGDAFIVTKAPPSTAERVRTLSTAPERRHPAILLRERRRRDDEEDYYDDDDDREKVRVPRRGSRRRGYYDEEDEQDDFYASATTSRNEPTSRSSGAYYDEDFEDEDDDDYFSYSDSSSSFIDGLSDIASEIIDKREDYDPDILVPNPIVDNIDPDGAGERFGEIARDPKFWRDLFVFVAILNFVDYVAHVPIY